MVQQMDVFLQAETLGFIDILFQVVESKVKLFIPRVRPSIRFLDPPPPPLINFVHLRLDNFWAERCSYDRLRG